MSYAPHTTPAHAVCAGSPQNARFQRVRTYISCFRRRPAYPRSFGDRRRRFQPKEWRQQTPGPFKKTAVLCAVCVESVRRRETMSDGPPPLVDSSSDEEELERWQRRRVPPVIDSGRDCDNSNQQQQQMPPLVNNNEDDVGEHVEEVLAEETSEAPEPPQRYPPSPDLNLRSNRQEAEQEAVEFCLARMKQTQNGLQVGRDT